MTTPLSTVIVPLLVFEAADCLMAIPASEIAHLEGPVNRDHEEFSADDRERSSRLRCDLGEYFVGCQSDGPWLRWSRGSRNAWLRVRRVIDVVPVALSALTPMPARLSGHRRTGAFLAAGVSGNDVFLLLDPARLTL